jgi:hypothetical protein
MGLEGTVAINMKTGMLKNLVLILASTATLLFAGVATAAPRPNYLITCLLTDSPVEGCPKHVDFQPGGAVLPRKLPAHELAPVGLEIHGTIAMEGGGHPVALHEVVIDVDKDVAVEANGLPACRRQLLEGRGMSAARHLCRAAIVGSGVAHVGLASSETTLEAPLTLFNGGTSGGETRLLVHTAIGTPNPVPVVSSVKVQRMDPGLHTVWRIPGILGGDGSLLDFKLKVERRFIREGIERSYLSARCPDGAFRVNVPDVLFRNDARVPGLENATSLKGAFALPCTPVP